MDTDAEPSPDEQPDEQTKVVIDLFSGQEGHSQAFHDRDDWTVLTLDYEDKFDPDIQADLRDITPGDIIDAVAAKLDVDTIDRSDIDVLIVLASPPCETFSRASLNAGNWESAASGHPDGAFERKLPERDLSWDRVGLVHYTRYIIYSLKPDWWFIENPVGMFSHVITTHAHRDLPQLTWCQYGGEVMKPTYYTGHHPPSFDYRRCKRGMDCHLSNPRGGKNFPTKNDGTDEERAAERARLPDGISAEVLRSVENPWTTPDGDVVADPLQEDDGPEQSGLADFTTATATDGGQK